MVSVVFTHYVIIGGNDGFASLWLILVPFLAMMVADLRFGFFMSLYFFVFLVLTFSGPMHSIIRYDYNRTFLLRFPILYFIAFSFATYSAVRTCHYQYKLDKREEELQRLGTVDMLTGLMNRNSYNAFAGTFRGEDTDVLTVIFIDVNGLHELNNRKGHIAGDDMLKKVSAACSSYFDRKGIYRMGGDEFLIICEDQDEASAEMKMKNVSEEIGKEGYSVSYGIESRESDLVLAAMINAADRKMLKRKEEYYTVHGRRGQ
jgi:diguanylate cyclase (GGDEF)-like protein